MTGVIALIAVLLALTFVLLLLVAWSKWRRDRAEMASARFRERVMQAWRAGDSAVLDDAFAEAARGHMQVQADLLAALRSVEAGPVATPDQAIAAHEVFTTSSLRGRLIAQVTDPAPVRRGLAAAFGGLRTTRMTSHSIAGLLADQDPTVRLAAAGALENHATPTAAGLLIEALRSRALTGPRLAERLGHAWAAPTVLSAISGMDETAQPWLIDALALAASPAAIGSLIALAQSSQSDEIAMRASRAIAACAGGAQADALADACRFARDHALDPRPVVRGSCAVILGLGGDQQDLVALVSAASDHDWFVRRQATQALINFGPTGVEALVELAEGADPYASARARQELALSRISLGGTR